MRTNKDHIDHIFGDHSVISEEKMRLYLNGELTPAEMHEVEKIMLEEDELYSDALEGMQMADAEVASQHIQSIKEVIPNMVGVSEPKQRQLLPLIGGIAASIALLIGVFVLFNGEEKEDTSTAMSVPTTELEHKTNEKKVISAEEDTDGNLLQERVRIDGEALSDEHKQIANEQDGIGDNELTPVLAESEIAFYEEELEESFEPSEPASYEDESQKGASTLPGLGNANNGDFIQSSPEFEVIGDSVDLDKGFQSGEYKNVVDYDQLSKELYVMNDPLVAQITTTNRGVTANSKTDISSKVKNKDKVGQPTVRDNSWQSKSQDRKQHKGKKKSADVLAGRTGPDMYTEGNQQFAAGNYSKAYKAYEAVLLMHPDDKEVLYRAGVSYLKAGITAKSISYLKRVTNDKQLGSDARWYLAIAYIANKDKENAQVELNKLRFGAHDGYQQRALKALDLLE